MFDLTKHGSTRLRRDTMPQAERGHGSHEIQHGETIRRSLPDHWTQLDRFLDHEARGDTLYVGEQPLTQAIARTIRTCLAENGLRVVRRATKSVERGDASRYHAAIFVLAVAARFGDGATRTAAHASLDRMARADTHLFDWLLRRLS